MEKLKEFAALIKPLFNAKGIFKMKAYRFGIAANSDNRLMLDIENRAAASTLSENGAFERREGFEFKGIANDNIFNSENAVSNSYYFPENKSIRKENVSENLFFQTDFDNLKVIHAFEKIPTAAVSSYFKGGVRGRTSGMVFSPMVKNSLLFSLLNMSNVEFGGGTNFLGGETMKFGDAAVPLGGETMKFGDAAVPLGGEMMKFGGRTETMTGSPVEKGENRFFEQRFSFSEKAEAANSNLEKAVYNFHYPTDEAQQKAVRTKKSFLEENYAAVDIDQIEDALAKRIHSQLLAGFPMF